MPNPDRRILVDTGSRQVRERVSRHGATQRLEERSRALAGAGADQVSLETGAPYSLPAPSRVRPAREADPPRMIAAAFWLLLQVGAPTVGDTIWLSRTVAVPAGRTLRARGLAPRRSCRAARSAADRCSGRFHQPSPTRSWSGARVRGMSRCRVRCCSAPAAMSTHCHRSTSRSRWPACCRRSPPDSALAPQPRADFVPRGERSVIPLSGGARCWPRWCSRRCIGGGAGAVPVIPWCPEAGRQARSRRSSAGPTPVSRAPSPPRPRPRLRSAIALRAPSAHRGLDTEALLVQLAADRPDWPLADVSGRPSLARRGALRHRGPLRRASPGARAPPISSRASPVGPHELRASLAAAAPGVGLVVWWWRRRRGDVAGRAIQRREHSRCRGGPPLVGGAAAGAPRRSRSRRSFSRRRDRASEEIPSR